MPAMAPLVLFEDDGFVRLLPLVFWRTVFELRAGRTILLDRTSQRLQRPVSGVWTRDWIARVAEQRCGAPVNRQLQPGTMLVNGRWLVPARMEPGSPPQAGYIGEEIAYVLCDTILSKALTPEIMLDPARRAAALRDVPRVVMDGEMVRFPWDLIRRVPQSLQEDWHDSDAVIEAELDPRVSITEPTRVHVGERTIVHPSAVLDAASGPIYISHDVRVAAHAVLEGPLYVGPGSRIHPHAWLHGATALGPVCKIGGEVDHTIVHGYTNKQHHGFLGHSYVGSWVNLGAGTTNSDLKNTFGKVRVPLNGVTIDSGEVFLGAIIGDHVKTAINSSLPTGAVFGFSASVAAAGMAPKYVPSFGWVAPDGIHTGKSDRMLDTASTVMARRNIDMTDDEVELFLDLGARVREFEAKP